MMLVSDHCICVTWWRTTHDQAKCTSSNLCCHKATNAIWRDPAPIIASHPNYFPKHYLQTPSANEFEDWVSDTWTGGGGAHIQTTAMIVNIRHYRRWLVVSTLAVLASLHCLQDYICNQQMKLVWRSGNVWEFSRLDRLRWVDPP